MWSQWNQYKNRINEVVCVLKLSAYFTFRITFTFRLDTRQILDATWGQGSMAEHKMTVGDSHGLSQVL